MAKPYSVDLRERAVAAVLGRGLSRHQAAAQFGFGVSTVVKMGPALPRHRQRGPGADGRAKPKAIAGEHHAFLARRIREGAFTLRGLVAELAERGLKVDYRSVWNFVHSEKLSFKKSRRRQRARSPPTWRDGEASGSRVRGGLRLSAWFSSTRPGRRPTWPR
jgi:transposase